MHRKQKNEPAKWQPIFNESTTHQEIAFVIDHTNNIEYQLKQIIAGYIAKDTASIEFAENILLHNSIVNLGAKFRLLQYITEKENIPKIEDSNCFHRFVELRNAFAHSDTVTQHMEVSSLDDGNVAVNSYYLLESLSSSGKPKKMTREEALDEFTECLMTIQKYLIEVVHKNLN